METQLIRLRAIGVFDALYLNDDPQERPHWEFEMFPSFICVRYGMTIGVVEICWNVGILAWIVSNDSSWVACVC